MNTHDIYDILEKMQPAMERMQTLIGSSSFQRTIRQIEDSLKIIAPAMERHRKLIAQFDFSFIVKVQKSFESIQTFYGLQFSTTIARKSENEKYSETHSFSCTTTISKAEHTRILSEKDYYKEKAFYWQAEFQKENNEKLQLQYTIQTYNSMQSFKQSLSIQNSNNAKKKEYTELKNWILEIAKQPQITSISKKSMKAQAIMNIVKKDVAKNPQNYNIIKKQIDKVQNLKNYIQKQL